jgi:uncharacterized protein (DUF362 family)
MSMLPWWRRLTSGPSRRAALRDIVAASRGNERYDRREFTPPAESLVALLPASDYGAGMADVIGRGLDLLQPPVRGRRVLLKPNLVEYEAGAMINTHPAVIAGAIEAFRRAGAREVVVGEGPGHRRDSEYLLAASGLSDVLRELRVPFVDLNVDDVRPVALRSRFMGLNELMLPVEVLKSDVVVSMAKLKTHHLAGMTAAMKNLFGLVPGAVYGWPKNILHFRGIDSSILDLNATVRPAFTIVDAVVAMEGDGPIMGTPRKSGFLAMGSDLVAVDATCARLMGLDPGKIGYLREASEFLGNVDPARLRQRGERPERFEGVFELIDQVKHFRRSPS